MHQIYENTFTNSPGIYSRLVVGNHNRRNQQNERVRKRPLKRLLQNKTLQSMYCSKLTRLNNK